MRKKLFIIGIVCLLVVAGVLLCYFQITTHIFAMSYPCRGIDVSHYQGEIDWEAMKAQGVEFAYIKATEGSSHADECYASNMEQAQKAGIAAGAYHFFSFDSPAVTQAEHFIAITGEHPGNLIPTIDIEFYGNKESDPPEAEGVRCELQTMLTLLEETYGCKPMIYTTQTVYYKYIKGQFTEYPLWIRNVYFPPVQQWTLWQYTDQLRPDGIGGAESRVDGDVVADFERIRMPR